MNMFCYQCQETINNSGCTIRGFCGKDAKLANLQDLLVYLLKGISFLSTRARKSRKEVDPKISQFIVKGLFATITNANFDHEVFVRLVREALLIRDELRSRLIQERVLRKIEMVSLPNCCIWFGETLEQFEVKAMQVGVFSTQNEDVRALRELITYGLKGLAAYLEHAEHLNYVEPQLYAFLESTLAATLNDSLTIEQLIALTMEVGKHGVQAMALLDKANTETYGHPEISKVNIGVGKNPGILISGHDLKDLEALLKQSEGQGVDIYTHSEMLPAHYYPAFKKYKHFVGNYGNAWWKQTDEFETFNGPVLFTTNCIVPPKLNSTYSNRVYTTGVTGFPGFKHIEGKDFTQIIEHAKRCAPPIEIEKGEIVGGFAHNQVSELAPTVLEAIKNKAITQFYVMAGCDGRMKEREYYTEFAKELPKNTVILTAGCAKYRYNKLDLGDINGIPRVLDAGQCNDSYSLALTALKLKDALGLADINELPIVYNIAWYEQKAIIVLLALLYLGVKNITLGPTLPGFLSPTVAEFLVNTFGISKISNVADDMEKFTGRALEKAA